MTKDAFTTSVAFKRILDQPNLWAKTGRPMRERYKLRSKLKCGLTITLKLKMQILEQAGFTQQQEAIWQLPGPFLSKIIGSESSSEKLQSA